MSTYKELVYMCLDELKLYSDDALYTEEHIMFLLSKYRVFLLKQRYSDVKKQIPESNYQTICLDLIEVPAISGEPCEGGSYLRSKEKIPFLMKIGNPRVYPTDYYQGEITYVSRDSILYVETKKSSQNLIYALLGPEKVRMTGIFEDTLAASELQCPDESGNIVCDILDREFPIESALVPPLIELVVKELLGAEYRPEDKTNDAKDELSEVATK